MDLNSASQQELAVYYQTHSIPLIYNAGVIVGSCVVSLLGCYSTLLLLGKQTHNRGLKNWAMLLAAAGTMASTGIWGMHFIGMHVRLHPNDSIVWYIGFNPGYTVMSLFVPLVTLSLVFLFLGGQAKVDYLRIVIAGFIFGGIVALMHFSASFNASFAVQYKIGSLVASIVIACVAATVALLTFFRWRNQWEDNWWKRLICAGVLATAVCGMHYIALVGTSWYVRMGEIDSIGIGKGQSNTLTIAIAAMCFVLCLLAVFFAFYEALLRKANRLNARQVVVASATFDKAGRLLVRSDGCIPLRVIDTDIPLRTIMSELDIRESTFQWLFRLSWDWSVLEPFLPRIFARATGQDPSPMGTRMNDIKFFKEAFVESAQTLANEFGTPIEKVGVLFDKMLPIGVSNKAEDNLERQKSRDDRSSMYSTADAIRGAGSEGVMLVLVRELSEVGQDSTQRYLSKGFRISETRFLAPLLSERLGIDKELLGESLEQLKSYARRGTRSVVQAGGVYVGLFAIRPSLCRQGGCEVLVYQFARHQVPAFRIPDVKTITSEIRAWLGTLRNMTLMEVSEACDETSNQHTLQCSTPGVTITQSEDLAIFQASMYIALECLIESLAIWPQLASVARISAEILETPSSNDDTTAIAQTVMFHVVLPEALPPHARDNEKMRLPERHDSLVTMADQPGKNSFVFTPFSLFNKTQVMLLRGPTSRAFFRQARLDLSRSYPADVSVSPTVKHVHGFISSIGEEGSDEDVKEKHAPMFDAKNWMPNLGRLTRSPSGDIEKAAAVASEVAEPKSPEIIGMTTMGLKGQMQRKKAEAAALRASQGTPPTNKTLVRPRTAPEAGAPRTPSGGSGSFLSRSPIPPAYSPPRRQFDDPDAPFSNLRPTTAQSLIAPPIAARRKSGNMRPHTADPAGLAPSPSIWSTQSEAERQQQEVRAQASRDARRQVDGFYSRQLNELADGQFFRDEMLAITEW